MPDLAFYCKAGDGPLPWVTFAVSTWLGEAWRQRRTAFDNVSYVDPANGFRLRVDITIRYQMPSDNSFCFFSERSELSSERSELSSERSELPCLSCGWVHLLGAWSLFPQWLGSTRCCSFGPERWTYRR